ncbi:hypothetical protein [Pasteuria penetrans]|uniref:hypothetical protein n=1 Tax=Pasteuria penetrans TaxID=86005 RepID=UPI000FB28B28|nr:hypothetical protein [Pasteuria penetrans]
MTWVKVVANDVVRGGMVSCLGSEGWLGFVFRLSYGTRGYRNAVRAGGFLRNEIFLLLLDYRSPKQIMDPR